MGKTFGTAKAYEQRYNDWVERYRHHFGDADSEIAGSRDQKCQGTGSLGDDRESSAVTTATTSSGGTSMTSAQPNFGRRLKTLKGLTPYEFIRKQGTAGPEKVRLDRHGAPRFAMTGEVSAE
jgi:hypothetical protein